MIVGQICPPWTRHLLASLSVVLWLTVLAAHAVVQQDIRTNGTNLFVDGGLATTGVNFPAGTVGSQVLEIQASVRFMKADGEAYGVNNGGTPYYDQINLQVVSPLGTVQNLIAPGDFQDGSNTGGFGLSEIHFRAGSGFSLTNVDPNTPQAGSFRPTGNLRNFENETPAGSWTLNLGDSVAEDGLSVDRWRLRIWSGDPQATVSSSSSFGNVLVGSSADLTTSVSNTGDTRAIFNDGTVVSTTLSGTFEDPLGGDFSLVGGNAFSGLTVGGTSADRDYRFGPTSRGSQSTTAQIVSDGGNQSLTLNGQGVAPQALVDTTAANAGPVRLGDTGTATVGLTNVGDGNLSGLGSVSNLNGSFTAASGLFTSSNQVLSLPDGGLILQAYDYAPTSRGFDTQDIIINLTNGSTDGTNAAQQLLVALSGQGVGPEFTSAGDVSGVLDFGSVTLSRTASLTLDLSNQTPDGDLGALTTLSLLNAQIIGSDAGAFSLLGFSPTLLTDGQSISLNVEFTPTLEGIRSATLSFVTDQNAPFGLGGQTFSFSLTGTGILTELPFVPEPSSLALGLSVLFFWLAGEMFWRRRRRC